MGAAARKQAAALVSLLVLCVGLAGVVSAELAEPQAEPADARPLPVRDTAPAKASAAMAVSLPPIASFAEIVERPLLSPSRRPEPAQPVGRDTPFTVTGIVVSQGLRSAVVTHGTPPVVSRITEGQDIDGWTVQSILSDRVVLARGAAQQNVKLVDKPSAAARAGAPQVRPN